MPWSDHMHRRSRGAAVTGGHSRLRRTVAVMAALTALAAVSLTAVDRDGSDSALAETTVKVNTFTGSLSATGTSWQAHSFPVTGPASIDVVLTWSSSANLNLFLRDPSVRQVGSSRQATGTEERVTLAVTESGTYSIGVKSRSGSASYTAKVTVSETAGPTPAPVASSARTAWAAQFMEGSKPRTREQAVAEAGRYRVIAAQPETYAAQVDPMKQANTNLTLLAYTNGTFTSRTDLPNSWYALDRDGNRIYSRGWPGNKLLNPLSAPAQEWVIDEVLSRVRASGYDGAFVDTMGIAPVVPGYASAVPIDPRTNQQWTRGTWLANRTALAERIKAALGSRPLVCNGLTAGGVYFSERGSKQLFSSGMAYGMAEVWLREPGDSLTYFRTEDRWRQDVDMLADAGSMGRGVVVTVKAWAAGTDDQKARYYRYALASFLLGNDGRSLFNFSGRANHMTAPQSLDGLSLGSPTRTYFKEGGVYQRPFERGLVLVNPTGTAQTIRLDKPYRTLDGQTVQSVVVGDHQGVILLI